MSDGLKTLLHSLAQRLQQLETDEARVAKQLEQIIDARKEVAGALVGVEMAVREMQRTAPEAEAGEGQA